MQFIDGRIVYSASDLNDYLECRHLVRLTRSAALRELVEPEPDEAAEMIAEKGRRHEAAYLARLEERFPGSVVTIEVEGWTRAGLERAESDTRRAMASGAPAIYRGTFFDGEFVARTDFLIRVDEPSRDWPWSYEVADTKLALTDKPYFIVQLAHYGEHVARVQGLAPARMHVVFGDGAERPYRTNDYAAYYRHLKAAFLASGVSGDAYPLPVEHCAVCPWSVACERRRAADDHLSLVASIGRGQIAVLEAAGIGTVAALAAAVASDRPAGMQAATFERLRRQARLQDLGRRTGGFFHELLEHRPAEGFGLLPAPAHGDLYFDMEGDQFFEIGRGLEYLFGFYRPADARYVPLWGTDRAGEKQAFEAAIDLICTARERDPAMHVYHYAPYERAALRRLAQQHGTRESDVDDLLRNEVLVDLYAVVRQSIAISQPSYSIKKLEPFYGMVRTADVRKGDDSIVMFERWLQAPERRELLDEIGRYNDEDCRSTHLLHRWLLGRRDDYLAAHPAGTAFRPPREPDVPCHEPAADGCKECEKRVRQQRAEAQITADQRRLLQREGDRDAALLASVLSYHRREENPQWWAFFDRCENIDRLTEFDHEAMGELSLTGADPYKLQPRDRNLVYTYRFPEQAHHLSGAVFDPLTRKGAGAIVSIDDDANLLCLKRADDVAAAAAITALIPGRPLATDTQKASLARIAALYLDGALTRRHPAVFDILSRAAPRLRAGALGATIQPPVVTPATVHAAVAELDRSYLFVQGPPGTGKTFTGARVILQLLREGKRVAVMANSHKVMHNMLHAIEAAAEDLPAGPRLRGVHKHSTANEGSAFESRSARPFIESIDDNVTVEQGDYQLVSGNAWLFTRPALIDRFDVLVIDEAGQTSLADALAVAPCAANVVLLGDPMQLAQVSQGHHGEGAGRSVLEHLLDGAATVAPDRGILLDVTYRMHPAIAAFVSQTVYEGRLRAMPSLARNCVESPGLRGAGLRYLPVAHAGNGRESAEEAAVVVDEIELLLAGTFVRGDAHEQPLTERDVLVVTPYNAQRRRIAGLLAERGLRDVRVGTVDKFQGQEAPVVFYSMATSSGDDVPRNVAFLFERNRFNVAISRAQCMSVLVCSPRLLDARCRHAEQIALVNLVCRYVEEAVAGTGGADRRPISGPNAMSERR